MKNPTRIPDHNLDDVEGEKEALVCDEYDRARDAGVTNTVCDLKIIGRSSDFQIDMCDVFQEIRFDRLTRDERGVFNQGLHNLYLRLAHTHKSAQKTVEHSMESLAMIEFERQQEQSKCNS